MRFKNDAGLVLTVDGGGTVVVRVHPTSRLHGNLCDLTFISEHRVMAAFQEMARRELRVWVRPGDYERLKVEVTGFESVTLRDVEVREVGPTVIDVRLTEPTQ